MINLKHYFHKWSLRTSQFQLIHGVFNVEPHEKLFLNHPLFGRLDGEDLGLGK